MSTVPPGFQVIKDGMVLLPPRFPELYERAHEFPMSDGEARALFERMREFNERWVQEQWDLACGDLQLLAQELAQPADRA